MRVMEVDSNPAQVEESRAEVVKDSFVALQTLMVHR